MAFFCVRVWVHNIEYTKTSLSLYFLTIFYNLNIILMRIIIPLFFDNFLQFAHHFNENYLTIQFFIQNQIFTTAASMALFLKYITNTWPRPIFVRFWRFFPHFDENCLTNLNLFSKSKSDYCSSNGTTGTEGLHRLGWAKSTLIFYHISHNYISCHIIHTGKVV